MRKIRILAVGLLVMCLSACVKTTAPPGDPGSKTADVIKVAVIAPLTGDSAFWGKQMMQGVAVAMQLANEAGGIKSGPYEGCLYEMAGPFDDRGDPTEATNIAQKLATMDDIMAVIGPANSSNAYAIMPILNQARIPVMSGGASNPNLTKQGWDCFFRAFLHDGGAAAFAAKYFGQKGYGKVVLAYSNNDYGRGIFEGFSGQAADLGIEILSADAWQPVEDRDFSSIITRWQTQEPEAIFIGGEYAESALLVKQARLAGMEQPIVNQGGFAPDFLEIAGDQAEGVIQQTLFDAFRDDDVTKALVEQFRALFGEEPAENGAIGYDAMLVLDNGLNSMVHGGREELIEVLKSTKDFAAMSYTITFDETGEMMIPDKAPMCVVKEGKYQSYSP